MNNNPLCMSYRSVLDYINSGEYIPPTLKKKLNDKVNNGYNEPKIMRNDIHKNILIQNDNEREVSKNGIKLNFAMGKSKTIIDIFRNDNNQTKSIPEICSKKIVPQIVIDTSVIEEKATKPKSIPKIVFNGKILSVSNQIDEIKSPTESTSVKETELLKNEKSFANLLSKKNDKSLITNDKIFLSYKNIQKMYKFYAIHRIRMQYISLNRMIDNLDLLENSYNEKGKQFKIHFNYDGLVSQERNLRKCIQIYIELCGLTKLFKSKETTNLFLKLSKNDKSFMNEHELFKKDYDKRKKVLELLQDNFSKYHKISKECFDFVDNFLEKINVRQDYSMIQKKLTIYYDKIMCVIQKIIEENDPHISCDYCVYFKNCEENIIPDGISTWCYLPCNKEIDLSVCHDLLQFEKLKNISKNEMEKYFMSKKNYNAHFLNLYIKNQNPSFISILYYIDEEIPNVTINMEIIDLPSDSRVLSSIVQNKNTKKNAFVPHMKKNAINWRDRKTKCDLYKITHKEYNSLDITWRNTYTFDDTCKHVFVIDFLFNKLCSKEENCNLIRPDMLESFLELAIKYSNVNEY